MARASAPRPPAAGAARQALAGLGDRQALHAAVLGFAHPRSGETLHFESDLPADLAALEAALAHTGL